MKTTLQKMIFWTIQFKKTLLKTLLTFLTVFILFGSNAQSDIQIVPYSGQEEIILNQKHLHYWENKESQKIANDFTTLTELDFKILPGKVPNFGFIPHDVWFSFTIHNTLNKDSKLILSINNANLDIIELITFSNGAKNKTAIQQGDLSTFNSREISAKKFALPFKIDSNDTIRCFLRINNGGEQFHFNSTIEKEEHFLQKESSENYFLGIYFGILFFILLFNIFMWVITKELLSRHYSFYLLTFLFLQLSLLGFGKQYIWLNSVYLSNHANPFFASASVYFLIRFSCLYLNLPLFLPKIDKLFRWLQYVILGCAILSLIPLESTYKISILLINALTLLLNIFILPVAISVMRKGYRPAILFLIAFFLLVVSVFAFVLKNFGILPSNFYTDFGFQFGSAAEVILFSLAIVIRFKNFREDAIGRLKELNTLKEEANVQLEKKVIERTLEIDEQRKEIESKNKEIISSISYAKRIQEAILPTEEKLKHLLPSSVMWYAPKDIVAGDFYWVEQKHFKGKDYIFFAVGDCTGHGVPGAMMSVLCTNSLNTALSEITFAGVAQILEKSSAILIENLSQHSKEINDGMDISIACLDTETSTLLWSGANNPLWLLRNNELTEFSGTKRPIGKTSSSLPFEEHAIKLEAEDRLFLFSDGIVDQFGGPNQKKFKKSQLRECILLSSKLSLQEQLDFIKTTVSDWQNTEEQVDDIALIIIGNH